jgi:hypothetical protein
MSARHVACSMVDDRWTAEDAFGIAPQHPQGPNQ